MSRTFNSLLMLSYSAKNKMIPTYDLSLITTLIKSTWMMQNCVSEVEN